MNHSETIYGFSYLRAVACIAIIILHMFASASILYGGYIDIMGNAWSRAISNSMMWAVPCFVMTTGALLLDKNRRLTYGKLFKKYIFRVLAALVICCILFRFFDMEMDGEKAGIGILFGGLYEMFTGTGWSHLWYLYLLIGLYLMMPFYKKMAEYSEKFEIKYLLAVYLLFVSILPLTYLLNVSSGFYIHVSTIYPFYLFCGYAVHQGLVKTNRWAAFAAMIISTGLLAIFSVIRWEKNLEVMEQLWSYSSILVVIQAVSIFILFDSVKGQGSSWFGRILLSVDTCSFGIYLIHMIFIRLILRYMSFNPYEGHVIINFLLLIIGTFFVSYLCTWILKKVPVIKEIL